MAKVLGVVNGSLEGSSTLEKKDKHWVNKSTDKLTYYVLGDTLADTKDTILAVSGIPPLFYPFNGGLCNKRTAKETTRVIHPVTGVPCGLWEVDCEFSSDVNPEDEQDPEDKPPVVRWYGETEEEHLEADPITGDPIQTDAGEPIFLTVPVVYPILEITRYEGYPFDPTTMLAYANHTNSTAFWGAPTGCALMLPMEVDEEIIEKVKYCKVTYKIKFKIKGGGSDTWKARVLHHGFKYRPAAGKDPIIFTDKQGNPATVNLQLVTGLKLGPADPPEYKEFNRFPKTNLNALSLGPF